MAGAKTISEKTNGAGNARQPNLLETVGISAEEFQAMGNMGAMFYEQGQFDKAQTIFEGMLELEPENDAVLSALGAVLTQQRQDDEALIHLNKAIELNDSEIASFVNRAEVRLRQSEFQSAVDDLTEAIRLDPHEKDAGANRARAMVLGIHQMIEAQKAREAAENN
jgi:tetratricopeptide (TPR) repeat protein